MDKFPSESLSKRLVSKDTSWKHIAIRERKKTSESLPHARTGGVKGAM